jgi:hypothetical protein
MQWNLLGHFGEHIKIPYNNSKWRWRRLEKNSWTDRVKNEVVSHRAKWERNVLYIMKN